MGVYEDLLKRKKIIEDQQGNVTVNEVVNKEARDKLTDNSIQTYKQDIDNNKSAIQSMKNIIKRTATNTIWEQMQNIMLNKSISNKNFSNSIKNNFKKGLNDENYGVKKNNNILEDAKGISKLLGLGTLTGVKQVNNYIENANENNFNNYKNLRKKQFLASTNVSEEDKLLAKSQDNLLLKTNGIDTSKKIETNLVKKAIQDSINKDEQKIQEEQSKLSNPVTQKLGEITPSIGQMVPGTVLASVNPLLGTEYFVTSAAGSYIDDAKQRGMTDEQAFKYGTVMGALEGASESLITGQQLSKVSKAFTGKNISKKILDSYGFNIFENAVQESIMEPAQEITAGIVGNKADWTDMGKRMAQSGFNGALMGAISNGVTAGLSKSGQIYNKIQNGETITETEYREALQENIDKFGKDVVKESMKNGATEVYQEINNLQSQSIHNQQNNQTQQITQQENKTAQNGNMEQNNINEFNGYTQKEIDNIKSNKISIAQSNEDISNFVNNSRKVPGNFKMYLGKITENVSNTIKSTLGINVDNYNISLKTDDVRKIFKDHGSEKTEIPRGQVPITENDFLNIPNIINNPDIVSEAGKSPQDKPVIKFEKNINGNNVVVTYVSDKHNNLELQTMYKFKNNKKIDSATALHENQTPGLNTSEMDSGTNLIINNSIPQNEQNVKDTITNNYMQNTENNTVENNQNSLYNINNESESDINGRINQRNDGTSRLFKESTEKQREYSWDEYNKWEESIKPTENITNKEQQSINKSKSEHNKDVFLYDENDNDNTYSGGASRNVKNKINISRQQAEYFGLDFMIDHETIESDILQNQELYEDIVKPVIEKIQKDNNFKKQVDEFWRNEEGNKPSDRLIAKDIFCDRFAQMRGNELKYENILSQETNMNIDYALNNFYKEIYGKEIEDSNKSSFNLPTKEDVKTKLNLPTKEKMNQPTQGEKINWNEIERPEGKIRKHYRSIIESGNTTKEAKAIAKELMGMDTYIPDSNNKQLERADTRIQNSTPESELDSLMSRATTGGKIDATDIAVGEKLIQYYSLIGDKAKLQESIQATAMAGTTAGQAVQAMSLLNHQTPEGQAVWIQRSVEKMNNDLRKARGEKAQQFDFTAEMQEKIVNSKNNEELQDNLNDVYKELGQQVNKNLIEKIDSWRYFSMLGNPKTHIRNMVGNFLMGKAQDTKNKVAGVIEGTVAKFNTDMERMHTIKRASKEVIDFAKNDIKNVSDRLGLNDNKYNPKSRLENNMRTFKSDVMENTLGRLFKWNDNLLEAEDGLGLKAGYKKALSEYITANNIDVNNITDTQLSKARNYAVQQAQERTFHQANIIASAINSFFGKNKATKAIGDAVLPFVKTPANVAKTGIEYSPAGLAKSIVYDSVQLRKGNINVNQYIDNVSKGLTGSAITVLGFALAQAGILKASGSDDDKKEKFDEQSGKQAYSIQIGDNTYTIDWLAPVGIPLMVGAEIYEGLSQKSNEKKTKSSDDEDVTKQFWDRAEVLANSLSNTLDPMVEMSMISGLTSTVRSFAQGDTQALGNMLTNGAKSYINQFVPTLLGQIAKTTDTLERDTTSTKSGTISKAVDSTTNQIKSKIPGLRQTLPTKKDIWGKDITLANNWPQRFFEAGILPTNSKTINKDKVVTELNNLYDKMGEYSILPTTIDKTFTIDGQKYRMTNEEYNKYKTNYGQTSYKLIKNLVSSEEYGKMNDKQKQKAIENVYNYAKESNKLDYAKNNKLECEQSTLYTTMQDLKNNGGSQSEYLNYLSKTTELNKDKDKNQILVDSNYTDKTKAIIYRNTTGKEDELYNNLLSKDNINININEYLKYKLQEFESDRKDDGTTSGEAISGSKKKKVYSYVNNMNITREQKLILLGMQYKLSNSERTELANLINKLPNTSKDEKMKLYEKMQGFTVYKNGTIKW